MTSERPVDLNAGGTGTVFLRCDLGCEPPLDGYWDLEPDDDPTHLEQLPTGLTLWEAIEWARERAPRVVVRFSRPFGGGLHWIIGRLGAGEAEVSFFEPRVESGAPGV